MAKFSYSKIVSGQAVDIALALAQKHDEAMWGIGDLALALIHASKASGSSLTPRDVCKAVGAYTGLRSQEVTNLVLTSNCFTEDRRLDAGHGVLSYGHYYRAMQCPNPREALQWCLDQIDELGRPASLDAMTIVFKPGVGKQPEELPESDEPAAVAAAKRGTRRKARRLIKQLVSDLVEDKLDVGLTDGEVEALRTTLERLWEKLK
jgi:hypothetical protein